MKIREIIVVEGKSDTVAVQRAVDADTIETNGSAINEQTIEKIKLAQEKRGVIILTDPDAPGAKIRQEIINKVPSCKHAFLSKEEARIENKWGLGVEHATPQAIRKALVQAQVMKEEVEEQITKDELIAAGLIGGEGARAKRDRLGKILRIGQTNGKQLHKRLMMFQISEEAFAQAMDVLRKEEKE